MKMVHVKLYYTVLGTCYGTVRPLEDCELSDLISDLWSILKITKSARAVFCYCSNSARATVYS